MMSRSGYENHMHRSHKAVTQGWPPSTGKVYLTTKIYKVIVPHTAEDLLNPCKHLERVHSKNQSLPVKENNTRSLQQQKYANN